MSTHPIRVIASLVAITTLAGAGYCSTLASQASDAMSRDMAAVISASTEVTTLTTRPTAAGYTLADLAGLHDQQARQSSALMAGWLDQRDHDRSFGLALGLLAVAAAAASVAVKGGRWARTTSAA
ncbi:hypothetical protein [Nitrospirillum pindoramense]|uniref:Transmembrane protein n=1 Tax=Nitrospirillum amazonense TaxID=28077 RepID=A0A560HJX7_9PROT|nr:hypothetical protein [Nitrospirillum amazonense]TWB45829.1 hypothetical protein FBZ90_101164 [Nitrospirillum amazonense]